MFNPDKYTRRLEGPAIPALAGSLAAKAAVSYAVSAGIIASAASFAATALSVVVTVGVSSLVGSVMGIGKPETSSHAAGVKINTSTAAAPIPVVYGRARVGINRCFVETTGNNNKYAHIIGSLCEGEVEAIPNTYFDDVSALEKFKLNEIIVDYGSLSNINMGMSSSGGRNSSSVQGLKMVINGESYTSLTSDPADLETKIKSGDYASRNYKISRDGNVFTVSSKSAGVTLSINEAQILRDKEVRDNLWTTISSFGYDTYLEQMVSQHTTIQPSSEVDLVRITNHLGADDQLADSNTVNEVSNWNSNCRLLGTAYTAIRLEYDRDHMYHIPQITSDVKGSKIKVWNGSSWVTEWSDNPIWCLRDYLTNTRYGRGIPESAIDDDTFKTAAAYCDETVVAHEFSNWDPSFRSNIITPGSNEQTIVKSHTAEPNKWNSHCYSESVIEDTGGDQYVEFYCGLTAKGGPFSGTHGEKFAVGLSSSQSESDRNNAEFLVEVTNTSLSGDNLLVDISIKEAGSVQTTFQLVYDCTPSPNVTVEARDLRIKLSREGSSIKFYTDLGDVGHGFYTLKYTSPYSVDDYYPVVFINNMNNIYRKGIRVKGYTSRRRYTLNGVIDIKRNMLDNIKMMLATCRGMLPYTGGKYQVLIDKNEGASPSATLFNKDNITGSWEIDLGDKRNKVNRIRAHFVNKTKNYESDVYVIDAENIRNTEDNGVILEKSIDLPYVTDSHQVQEIGIMMLNQSRQSIRVSFTATIEGSSVTVGSLIKITHDTPGWTDKLFRVIDISLKNNDEVTISAMEYDVNVYSYTVNSDDYAPDTYLPDPDNIDPVSNIRFQEDTYNEYGAGTLHWDEPDSPYIDHYEVKIGSFPTRNRGRYLTTAVSSFLDGENLVEQTFTTRTNMLRLPLLDPGIYRFYVYGVNSNGTNGEPIFIQESITFPDIPTVSRFRIKNSTDNGDNYLEFTGGDVLLGWNHSDGGVRTAEALGLDVANGKPTFIKHYEIEVYGIVSDSAPSTPNRIIRTEENEFNYTIDMNKEDYTNDSRTSGTGAFRELKFKAYIVNQQGKRSTDPAQLPLDS